MAWRKDDLDDLDRQSHQRVFTTAAAAAGFMLAFVPEVEAYLWRVLRRGLGITFSETGDVDLDNDVMQTLIHDAADQSDAVVEMRRRLVALMTRLARDMHHARPRVTGDDAPLAWAGDGYLRAKAKRLVAEAWERHLAEGSGTDRSLCEAATYRSLRAKADAMATIIDHATASIGVFGVEAPRLRFVSAMTDLVMLDRKRSVEKALAGRRISDGARSFTLLQVKRWDEERSRAEMTAKLEGVHQIADAEGWPCVSFTYTLPARFHAGGTESFQAALAAVYAFVVRVRSKVRDLHLDHEIDSHHEDKAAAHARKDEINADGRWTARTRLAATVGADGRMRWVVQAAECVGQDAMGAVFVEPHETDGSPHAHGFLRMHPAIVPAFLKWLATQAETPDEFALRSVEEVEENDQDHDPEPKQIVAEVRQAAEARKASNYAAKYVIGRSDKVEKVQEWAKARGVRQVRWIGVSTMKSAWRAIYDARVEEITVGRAMEAKEAMGARRWGDALIAIGAVHSRRRGRPALRLAYDDVETAVGPRRRAVGIVDPLRPEEGIVPLRPIGRAWLAQQQEEKDLSKVVRGPSTGDDLVDPDDQPDLEHWLAAAE